MGTNKWKFAVRERDGFKCRICGSSDGLTVHHKVPVARDGKSTLENCVCWCKECHRKYHEEWGLAISDDVGNPIGIGKKQHHSKRG